MSSLRRQACLLLVNYYISKNYRAGHLGKSRNLSLADRTI